MIAKASDRKAAIYSVRVQTPPTDTRLAAPEKAALKSLAAKCCNVARAAAAGGTNLHICAAA